MNITNCGIRVPCKFMFSFEGGGSHLIGDGPMLFFKNSPLCVLRIDMRQSVGQLTKIMKSNGIL